MQFKTSYEKKNGKIRKKQNQDTRKNNLDSKKEEPPKASWVKNTAEEEA